MFCLSRMSGGVKMEELKIIRYLLDEIEAEQAIEEFKEDLEKYFRD